MPAGCTESAALLIDEVFPKEPIRQWVLSFPFQLRFLLARHPQLMGQVLSIVYRTLSTHLIKKAGYTKASAQTGSVTLIQRFGSALNLNVHYHMLFLDGVYAEDDYGKQRFHRVKAPTYDELNTLAHTLSHRIARCMEKRGILERDAENTWLTLEEGEDDTLTQLHGASVTYRIAVGPQQGRKVFTLQTLPGREDKADSSSRVANHAGFSLHAGVMVPKRISGISLSACVATLVGTSGFRKTSGINRQWAGALRAQNSVPQWHHPCDLRAAGLHRQTRCVGT